ncbi:MAG TPA: hypothetical protein V6C86_22920 [Oculatellaceae cyanobacterium]
MTQHPEQKVEKSTENSRIGDKPIKDGAITTADGNQRQTEIKRADAYRSFKLTSENSRTGEKQQSFAIDMGDGREVKDERKLRVDASGDTSVLPKDGSKISVPGDDSKKLVDTISARMTELNSATQNTAMTDVLNYLKTLRSQESSADSPSANLTNHTDAVGRKSPEYTNPHKIADKELDKVPESSAAAASHKKLDAWADHQIEEIKKQKHILEKDPSKQTEVTRLSDELAELRKFKREISEFEKRCAKQGIDPREVEKTLLQLERITEAKGESPTSTEGRRHIAEQILHQATEPQSIDQGSHNTCNVTTVEIRTYTRTPSEAAKMVADIALTGQYTSHPVTMPDGTVVPGVTVHLNPSPHDQSTEFPPQDGFRTYASELFQVTAVNVHYRIEHALRHSDIEYRQKENKEELWDKAANKPVMKNGKPCREPNLDDRTYGEISDAITGKNEGKDVAIVNGDYHSGKLENVLVVKSPQELEDQLKRLKAQHKLPVIIRVNCECDPFYQDSGRGESGDSVGSHVVTITDYDEKKKLATVDNQWGAENDHEGTRSGRIRLNDLYISTQNSNDALKSVKEEIAKSHGHPDRVKLMEEARLELVTGQWDAKKHAFKVLHDIEKEWNGLSDAEKNRDRIALIAMFGRMETTDRIDCLAEAHHNGMIYDNKLEEQLVTCGVLSELNFKRHPWDWLKHNDEQERLKKALNELPEGRRKPVLNDIKTKVKEKDKEKADE